MEDKCLDLRAKCEPAVCWCGIFYQQMVWSIRKEEELSNVLYTDNSWSLPPPAQTYGLARHRLLATPHYKGAYTHTGPEELALHDIINWR